MLWSVSEWVLVPVLIASFFAVIELGYRLGLRRSGSADRAEEGHVSALVAAMLGLLALLLGFTFFMAVSRFDTRKALVLDEANAIGTTWLRARFLPSGQVEPAQALLQRYVSARLAFYDAGIDPARLAAANTDATRIETELWALALAAADHDPRAVPTGLFVESLNDMIDLQEKRQTALDNHVPEAVILLLALVSGAALGLLGYGCGLARRRRLVSNMVFALLIVLVLATILDIDRPRRGLIQVSQDSMLRLQASMAPAR